MLSTTDQMAVYLHR